MKVLLSQDEIDALYSASQYVGGSPDTTLRGSFTMGERCIQDRLNSWVTDTNLYKNTPIKLESGLYYLNSYK